MAMPRWLPLNFRLLASAAIAKPVWSAERFDAVAYLDRAIAH